MYRDSYEYKRYKEEYDAYQDEKEELIREIEKDDVDILKSGLKKVTEGRDEDLTQIEKRLVDEYFSNINKQIEETDKFIAELKMCARKSGRI